MLKVVQFALFFGACFGRVLKHPRPERRLQPKMYMMDPTERMEQNKILSGQPPKGNRIEDMKGGLLNVELGTEGAPVYIDQSPSYLYKDPKTPFNQNGVRMPLTQQNQFYRSGQPQLLESNFYKPRDYDNTQAVYLPSIQDEGLPERRLSKLRVKTLVSR